MFFKKSLKAKSFQTKNSSLLQISPDCFQYFSERGIVETNHLQKMLTTSV